jgi:membrane associated rhomboid family serine protease
MNGRFAGIPLVVKNLLIINILALLASFAFESSMGININRTLGLFYFESESFRPFQIVTHMFMHGGLTHLFFNMFALWMFGRVLESVWGGKRFFIYYFVTGLGAAALHTFVNFIEVQSLMANLAPEQIALVKAEGAGLWANQQNYTHEGMAALNRALNIPTVGASGAVFGVLLAFGMLFPNTQLMLLIPPIPIKAKYFVIIYGVIELYLGLTKPGSNIAHFAHLGGMLFGFLLIKYWNRNSKKFF